MYMNRINWFIHIFLNQEVVGKTDRTGDKTLNLQHFFAMSFGLSVENIYYIAIVVLACILGAEIAGICMLIGKMRRARNGEADAPNDEYDNNTGANYALAALSFGAVSATAELVLLVLAIAALVGAFVLCVLLVAFYAKGYLLISAKAAKEAEDAEAKARAEREAEQEAIQASATEELYDVEEPAEQYDDYADDEVALEAVSNLIATEDAVMSEEYEEEEEETVEPEEAVETAVVAQESTVPAVQTVERTIITEGAPAYGGQAPIVEKHIIETTKEIIKETNTTTVTEGGKSEQFSPATEEMMKAITEFMKLETQLRMEREVPVERPAAEDGASTPAFADAEDEEIEADEVDTEDELDAEDEAQREADAEENDDEYESDLFGNERIVGFDEETGCYIIARYRKSCEAKLMQSRPQTKKYYSAIRNALMGYEGTKERMSWTIDTYTNEHTPIAKINVRPRTLDLYLALEPSTLEDSVYRGKDVGAKKKYAETPFLYKVNSPRKLTLALELVQRACEEQGLSPIDIEEINYEEQYPFTDTETLITRGLIREYLREEKPAATFELDPDHVPQLIVEDETVIPANANFTWEFDNDQPEHEEVVEEPVVEEPVVEEEPIVEEEPVVEEPTVEEAPAAPVSGTTTTTTTHETIRTTERHYTERYFAGAKEAEVKEETRTIEVLPEPVAEPIEAVAEEIAPEAVAEEPTLEEQPTEEAPAEEAVEETAEETAEEIEEEVEEEIIDDEIVEEPEEATTDEQVAQMQSAVAALFGDDVFDEDEPIEEPTPEVVEEPVPKEVIEEETVEEETVEEPTEEPVEDTVEETVEEEPVEEPAPEAEAAVEVVEDVIEEVYEEEAEEEVEEEVIYEEAYEEEPEEEIEEEVIYEEVYEEEPEEEIEEEVIYEEVYEEEPEETEEEYYEEIVYEEEPEEETEEEYYEEIVYEEAPEEDEEYYEEVYEEVYEDVEGEEYEEAYEEVYEEEVEEEEVEEPAPTPAPQPASDVVLLDVCVFDDYFDNGAIVNLETLKQVGLAPESATRLKVYASGALKGQFTVEANHFTLDAIKAIGDADGDSIMIR